MENQAIEMPDKLCNGCLFSVKSEREALELACQDLLDIVKYTNKTKDDLVHYYVKKAVEKREKKMRCKLTIKCQGLNKHVISDKYTLEELLELYESKKEIDFKLIDGSLIHGYLIGFVQDRSQVM